MQPRLLGGFLVLPTSDSLARVHQPGQRAELIRASLLALKQHRQDLAELRADTIIEMRAKRRMKCHTIARRFGLTVTGVFNIAAARRADLEGSGQAPVLEVLADAA